MMSLVSEDLKKIVALIIVALSFVSVPLLLFFFVVMIYLNALQIIQFNATRAPRDALLSVLLVAANTLLFFGIRALIHWVRK